MSGGVRRCEEVPGTVRRCQEVSGDVRRCQEVSGGFRGRRADGSDSEQLVVRGQ